MFRIISDLFVCFFVVFILIAFGAGAAPGVIGGVAYDNVDEGETFAEARPPIQDWTAPRPRAAESKAGMMAFQASDPGEYLPNRIPRGAERVKQLNAFVSTGETTCLAVAVHALKNLNAIDATLDLQGAPVSAELRHMHSWPQRTGWKSRKWYTTTELLLPFADGKKSVPDRDGVLSEAPFDLSAGGTVGLWITVKAPVDARPGNYHGALSVSARGGRPLTLPFTLEVLPISLQRPHDRNWLLYGDSERWKEMDEEQVASELRDYAAHGFNGLVQCPFGSLDLSGMRDGRIRFDDAPYRALVARCKAAGMPGPHVCTMHGVPKQVSEALGIQCDLAKDAWPEALRKGVSDVAKVIVDTAKDAGAPWYFYGVDEPTGDNTYAIQEYQCWHDAGALTYATFYKIDFLEKASAYLTTPCFVSGLVGKEDKAKEARETCEKTGSEFWYYGTGCYVNPAPQESAMFYNRYGAGLFLWKTGAKASVTWTFCRPHGDVFNDFDGATQNSAEPKEQATVYPHLLRPNDWSTYQGAIPTVAWESLREGYNDYLYLNTLAIAIEKARSSDSKSLKRKADKAEQAMKGLVADIPLHNPMDRPAKGQTALTSLRLEQLRHSVVEQILALQTQGQ